MHYHVKIGPYAWAYFTFYDSFAVLFRIPACLETFSVALPISWMFDTNPWIVISISAESVIFPLMTPIISLKEFSVNLDSFSPA